MMIQVKASGHEFGHGFGHGFVDQFSPHGLTDATPVLKPDIKKLMRNHPKVRARWLAHIYSNCTRAQKPTPPLLHMLTPKLCFMSVITAIQARAYRPQQFSATVSIFHSSDALRCPLSQVARIWQTLDNSIQVEVYLVKEFATPAIKA